MRLLEGSCKAKGRLYPSLLSLQAHGVGAKAAGGASRDSDTALCFQARPSFQVSRINPTANECSPSPSHPSAVLFEQAPRGLETPGGQAGGLGVPAAPIVSRGKELGLVSSKPI